jgi:hypothetical protein
VKVRTAAAAAERMGRRAGERFRRTGIPFPCPFRTTTLAAAWRRGYMAGVVGGSR